MCWGSGRVVSEDFADWEQRTTNRAVAERAILQTRVATKRQHKRAACAQPQKLKLKPSQPTNAKAGSGNWLKAVEMAVAHCGPCSLLLAKQFPPLLPTRRCWWGYMRLYGIWDMEINRAGSYLITNNFLVFFLTLSIK